MRASAHSRNARRRQARRRLPIILGAIFALLILSRGLLWLGGAPIRRTEAPIGGTFRLVSGTGKIVAEREFQGKYLLIYFGYTSCPDVCPTTLNDVAQTLARLGPRAARVQALFITIDPERDTPPLVARYLARFSPSIILNPAVG